MKKIMAIVLFCFGIGTILIGFQNCSTSIQEQEAVQKKSATLTSSSTGANSETNNLDTSSDSASDNSDMNAGSAKVLLSTSYGAQIDCSRTDAFMSIQIQNVSSNLLLCMEYVLSGPGPRTGETAICDSPSKFASIDSSWTYDQSVRKWSQPNIALRNSPVFVPGSYRVVAKDDQGQIYKSAYALIQRSGQANCLVSGSTSSSSSSSSTSTSSSGGASSASSSSQQVSCYWGAGIVAGPVAGPTSACSKSNVGAQINTNGYTFTCRCN